MTASAQTPTAASPETVAGGGVVLVLDALAARFGGAASTVRGLSAALLDRDDVARVVVVHESDSMLFDPAPAAGSRFKTISVEIPRAGRIARRIAWQAARLPAIVESERADLLLSFSGMLPRHPSCRVISFVSNALPYERPNGIGDASRRYAIARTMRRSHRVYAPSRAMANLIGETDATVIPHGVDHDLFGLATTPGSELLAVGDFYPHKRHDLVVAAWERLPEPRPPLRLIGNPAVDRACFAEVRRLVRDPRIRVDGLVAIEDLVESYRRARVLVMASEHESFAMPVAEAYASGTPAVVRDLPAVRETGGAGAVYVTGDDPGTWAKAIHRVLSDDVLHAELRAAALRHVQDYTWSRVADTVIADARARP